MLNIDAEQTIRALPFRNLLHALKEGFVQGANTPDRHHHTIDADTDATLLLMPAWFDHDFLGVKLVNVFPANTLHEKPALSSVFVLASATTGEHLAIIDGNELTRRRTVATSALAASYLARAESTTHLVVGAGHVGSLTVEAYRSVFDIRTVLVHDQSVGNARRLTDTLRQQGLDACVVGDLASAAAAADIITCATLATEPIIQGDWLRPGTHLDLIGSFRPTMREADDQCIRRGTVFIDTPQALRESGDLTQPLDAGILTSGDIAGTLHDLCAGTVHGRRTQEEITIFKAVGSALADLAVASAVYRSYESSPCAPSSQEPS
jgi:ornithine cyclodeaminase/alanine dehydrogenase-like protein (mu-crystallin family)